jgi:hypothetical protein
LPTRLLTGFSGGRRFCGRRCCCRRCRLRLRLLLGCPLRRPPLLPALLVGQPVLTDDSVAFPGRVRCGLAAAGLSDRSRAGGGGTLLLLARAFCCISTVSSNSIILSRFLALANLKGAVKYVAEAVLVSPVKRTVLCFHSLVEVLQCCCIVGKEAVCRLAPAAPGRRELLAPTIKSRQAGR